MWPHNQCDVTGSCPPSLSFLLALLYYSLGVREPLRRVRLVNVSHCVGILTFLLAILSSEYVERAFRPAESVAIILATSLALALKF